MSQMRFAITVAGTSLAAAAAGCAVGLLLAPTSGARLRRRLAWSTRRQHQAAGRAYERMVERTVDRAREELKRRTSCVS
ncbi:MAG TPA: YtxH domain-containing protein [Vicinamibacterales bacterium]|jgi:gas vesicle protein|nr:YtxH domain-containing protein [Vicinamibacterales bacterium]